jgi:hypothetical protein
MKEDPTRVTDSAQIELEVDLPQCAELERS